MILVTHGVIGGAVASLMGNPAAGFFAAWGSHYVADAIPHWHYHVPRIKYAVDVAHPNIGIFFKKKLAWDLAKITVDALAGYVLVLFFFDMPMIMALGVAFGSMLPDFLTGVRKMFPSQTLTFLHRFHAWAHARTRLDDWPILGPGFQGLIIIFSILFFGG